MGYGLASQLLDFLHFETTVSQSYRIFRKVYLYAKLKLVKLMRLDDSV